MRLELNKLINYIKDIGKNYKKLALDLISEICFLKQIFYRCYHNLIKLKHKLREKHMRNRMEERKHFNFMKVFFRVFLLIFHF